MILNVWINELKGWSSLTEMGNTEKHFTVEESMSLFMYQLNLRWIYEIQVDMLRRPLHVPVVQERSPGVENKYACIRIKMILKILDLDQVIKRIYMDKGRGDPKTKSWVIPMFKVWEETKKV